MMAHAKHPSLLFRLPAALVLLLAVATVSTAQERYYLDLENKVRTAYDRKDYAEASQAATELLSVYPDNLQVNILQAASLMFMNKPAEARHYVDVALELDPS